MTDPKTRNPLHTWNCPSCDAPCGTGRTHFNETIHFDLRARVWALVGDSPMVVVQTELAAVDHREVCPYRDV